jgi:hypothetical protein
MKAQLLTALVVVAIPLVSPASAADWYVDASAAEAGDGSFDQPWSDLHDATRAATAGDRIFVASGTYTRTRRITVGAQTRRTLLDVPDGVEVIGADASTTILEAPETDGPLIFGITSTESGRSTLVSGLQVRGPCFQGVNLRNASITVRDVEVRITLNGTSSTAVDVRDGSDPLLERVTIDGGHSGLFIEFGSAGTYRACTVAWHPNEGLGISQANPEFEDCTFEGAGRDLLVLNQGSLPAFTNCSFGPASRWVVRVAVGYDSGVVIDLGQNRWYTTDLAELELATLDAKDQGSLGATVDFLPILGSSVPTGRRSVGGLKANWRSHRNGTR